MSDWFIQFSSSYVSAIAYGITLVVFGFFLKRMYTPTANWIKKLYIKRLSKPKSKIILPTNREQQRYSKNTGPTEKEWRDAIDFLKYDLDKLVSFSAIENSLTHKFLTALQKIFHILQYLSIVLGILNFEQYIVRFGE